jgi:hypothetical protein
VKWSRIGNFDLGDLLSSRLVQRSLTVPLSNEISISCANSFRIFRRMVQAFISASEISPQRVTCCYLRAQSAERRIETRHQSTSAYILD